VATGADTDVNDDGAVYSDDPRIEVANLTPPGIRVLDVGCSRGAFGAELKRRDPERIVYGIEPTAAVVYARKRLDNVAQGFFPLDIPTSWEPFDVVCFNDVLEHISDPWTVLTQTLDYLTPNGQILASIPNVRYINVVLDLVFRGEWHYEDNGVLDRTHLRFFTRKSILEMFSAAGLRVDELVATHLDESRRPVARVLRRSGLTGRLTDILAQRYVVVATPLRRPTSNT
jgi:2-polyprenyl-3-methyl-5-hydroxy-6-metoxy-1,4-benzoquinol methylase